MTDPTRLLSGDGPTIIAKAAALVADVDGATEFELSYTAADRVLAADEEPRPDEAVAWSASATLRRKYAKGQKPITRTITGTAITRPGESHDQTAVDAVVELLARLGSDTSRLGGPS